MSRKGSKENPIEVGAGTIEQAAGKLADLLKPKKPFEIKSAMIKDDYCNYSYEITDGVGLGDTHEVKGSAIVHDDLKTAFSIFNVHLAFIDDVFKHAGINFDYINALHGHELTQLYQVTGFKIKGSEENEGIVLIGTKFVSGGGRISLESPKITLDKLSSYKWAFDLRHASDKAREEVELYKGGKCTPVEVDEEKPKRKQSKLFDGSTEEAGVTDIEDEGFENARV